MKGSTHLRTCLNVAQYDTQLLAVAARVSPSRRSKPSSVCSLFSSLRFLVTFFGQLLRLMHDAYLPVATSISLGSLPVMLTAHSRLDQRLAVGSARPWWACIMLQIDGRLLTAVLYIVTGTAPWQEESGWGRVGCVFWGSRRCVPSQQFFA